MTHKYRGCIAVFSISKSVEPNEEQKVLANGMDQEFSEILSKRILGVFDIASKHSTSK